MAFGAGIGVTALLVTSFVAQGLMTPALAIMLGANVGTPLMARVLTFDLSWLSPMLIFLGVIFFLSRKQTLAGQLDRVGISLGLMLLALEVIAAAAALLTAILTVVGLISRPVAIGLVIGANIGSGLLAFLTGGNEEWLNGGVTPRR